MLDFTQKLLLARQFRLERGEISLLKQPVLIIPSTALAGLSKIMTEQNTGHILYEMERDSIPPFVSELKKINKVEYQELLILMKNLAETAGWGFIDVVEYNKAKNFARFVLQNAPISKLIGKCGKQMDHIERGLIVGSMREIQKNYTLEGFETKCISNGDSMCEIVVRPIEDFDKEKIKDLLWQIGKQ